MEISVIENAADEKKREKELIRSASHYEYTVARVLNNRNGSTNQEKLAY